MIPQTATVERLLIHSSRRWSLASHRGEQRTRLAVLQSKPTESQLSILNGTWPTVVDHIQRMRVAWKNSLDCGTTKSVLDMKDRAHSYSFGARLAASSSEVCRTAIKQHAQNNKGDLFTRGRRAAGLLSGSKRIQRP